ncbi:MAG: 2-C-methyl-D-erythritol 4-phosphate cytidylyltransferase [Oscillospiraceae bacterium]|jgi:2-C-methyl-D-erythritol 4-phosphate cytidylyltransferase|nr:2-C-methyl-D-erythritol 4-phosphate cytidylyltransferase [Oscillospiraceae bacterium]
MVIAAILAGGSGSRMGNTAKPKQFMELGGKPILLHTVDKFLLHPEVDGVAVLCPAQWVSYTKDLLSAPEYQSVEVLAGGATRNETLKNALEWARHIGEDSGFGGCGDNILVTHDAVRPFVTHRIISENIAAVKEGGACDTVVPATDTIVRSADGKAISEIPPRPELYQGQTPQSFRCKELAELMESLTQEEEAVLTDACKIYVLRGRPVYLVQGEVYNMKITYPYDVKVAKALLDLDLSDGEKT